MGKLPSGFKSREDYNQYMREYRKARPEKAREYRRRRKEEIVAGMQELELYRKREISGGTAIIHTEITHQSDPLKEASKRLIGLADYMLELRKSKDYSFTVKQNLKVKEDRKI